MTTSHSSPSPAGVGVAERAGRLGQRAVGEAAARLDAEPLLDPRVDRVAERREDLRHQQQLVVEAEARALHAAQEVFAGAEVEAAEAPGEGQPLEGAQAEPDPASASRGESEVRNSATGPETSTSRSAAGRPSSAGRHRLADRAQGALLGGREPRRALSAGGRRAADAAGQRPEPERQQRQEAVDEEVEQVDEDVVRRRGRSRASRARRRSCRPRGPAAAAGSGRRRPGRPGRCR